MLIVISGPSGVGKDAVLKALQSRTLPLYFVVTATTREPRPGEVHGVDYYFLSMAEFTDLIARDELLEHNLVYGDYKGIPKEQVRHGLASGKDVLLRIDVQGAAVVRGLCPEALMIFLTPAHENELALHLKIRNSESVDSLKVRLETAREEMKHLSNFDYLVVNREGRLQETVDTIGAIITAEHHRIRPRKVSL
jgi:guanylate kinase